MENKGYIYILTNPSFPTYVKIGYADDVNARVREFYAMTAEDAYALFEAMAEIHGTETNLKLWRATEKERSEEQVADEIATESAEKKSKFTFKALGIGVGEELEYIHDRSIRVTVADELRHVSYNGETWTLSALAQKLLNRASVQGTLHFSYKGELLVDMRERLGV